MSSSLPQILRLPPNIVKIEKDGKTLFFNPEIPSWLVTNKNGTLLLSMCEEEMSTEDILVAIGEALGPVMKARAINFFKAAVSSRLFERAHPNEIPIYEESQSLCTVQLSISSRCNLNCKYCYATDRIERGFNKLSFEDYKRIIDEIIQYSPDVEFTLTGGEPMLNKDVYSIAQYARNCGASVDILTNGTLINENNIESVKSSFDHVSISLDGSTPNRHDHFRGQGSYSKSIKGIELLQSHEIPYRISMTVNRDNIDDVENMAMKWGSHLSFAPLFPAGNAKHSDSDLSISGMEYYLALKRASGVNPLGYCESTLISSQECRRCKCAIGGSEISISETGDVYPCQLLHYPEFLIGNVHELSISDMLKESPQIQRCSKLVVDNIEGCSTCFLRYVCGGACRARAYHESGNILTCGTFCEYEKRAFIDGIFSLYSHNAIE